MTSRKEWLKDETFDLIASYEQYQILWDTRHVDYKNRDKKINYLTNLILFIFTFTNLIHYQPEAKKRNVTITRSYTETALLNLVSCLAITGRIVSIIN